MPTSRTLTLLPILLLHALLPARQAAAGPCVEKVARRLDIGIGDDEQDDFKKQREPAAQGIDGLTQRLAALPRLAAEPRAAALTAIADALPFAPDGDRAAAVAELRRLAADGIFYSPAADQPTLTWFEYERALRRAEVRDAGDDPAALLATVQAVVARRAGLAPLVRKMGAGQQQVSPLYALMSFGWHGAGEVLEAVADLAARRGNDAHAAGAELAKFLACEQPHPLQPHVEGAAGLGEPPPSETPARHFPVLWGDGYRIALARCVLATAQPDADQANAVLHLLYSPRRADRLDAIGRLRLAPLGADAVLHLVAQLGDADRLVVRETISALGAGGDLARAAREPLQKLAADGDRELRAVAARALEQLGER